MARALLVHNRKAGSGQHDAGELVGLFRAAGYEVTYQSAKEKPGFLRALREPVDLVVAAGGDGTVAKVAFHLADRRTPVAILPLGGANNIARSLGIEGATGDLVPGLADMRPRRLDVGHAHGPWGSKPFLEGIGLGALADASAEVHAAKVGHEDKLRAGREALRRTICGEGLTNITVKLDGRSIEGEGLILEALKMSYSGAALPLAPHADPGDGLLDLVWVEPSQRDAILRWLEDEDHPGAPPASMCRGRRVSLTWQRGALRVDDAFPEPPDGPCEIVGELEGAPIRVLSPAEEQV